eukprot:Gb_04509 [translate_table: standard]
MQFSRVDLKGKGRSITRRLVMGIRAGDSDYVVGKKTIGEYPQIVGEFLQFVGGDFALFLKDCFAHVSENAHNLLEKTVRGASALEARAYYMLYTVLRFKDLCYIMTVSGNMLD